ncbi:hypothetical protein EDC96DRAFT_162237 [Choanephora cucurbitarum]|nr:hypothetical protein EDC96DRAFT_162237 [Choanephora cucurbitarum]
MSSNTRKPIQPRPTKASMLRLQKQQDAVPVTTQSKPVKTEPKPSTLRTKNTVGASDGVKAFMAQQRARMGTKIEKIEEEPKQKKGNFMTGAERYGGGEVQDDKPRMNTRSIQVIIKQAKSLGKLDISSRGLAQIPDEVLNMYHVDPKSIVIDFSSSGDA